MQKKSLPLSYSHARKLIWIEFVQLLKREYGALWTPCDTSLHVRPLLWVGFVQINRIKRLGSVSHELYAPLSPRSGCVDLDAEPLIYASTCVFSSNRVDIGNLAEMEENNSLAQHKVVL